VQEARTHGDSMKKTLAIALLLSVLGGCGGGGGAGGGTETASTTPPVVVQNTGQLIGLGPNSLGQAPNADGYYPDSTGSYPNSLGIYPDRSGIFPSPAELGLFPNEGGVARTYSTAGPIDQNNPFFKPFGNGRSCASCHQQSEGFSITPKGLLDRFIASDGKDPIFMLNDGANSPLANFRDLDEKQVAYSMLLSKGLIRVGMAIPPDAEFELFKADDPYQFASAKELSLFRRPLPSANLKFLSDVMWDGRETTLDAASKDCLPSKRCFASIDSNLAHQANSATLGHAQAVQGLSSEDQTAIVAFEKTLFSAQTFDKQARFLDVANAQGGAVLLQKAPSYFGINDLEFGNLKTGASYTREVMQNFTAWKTATGTKDQKIHAARQSIARGEVLFNTRSFNLSDQANVPNDLKISLNRVTCSSCHNALQAGSASTPFAVSIFTSESSLRTPDLPLYTLRNKATGVLKRTLDPGVAMKTGKWEDIGRFKVPTLRGLAARAPYFHNGSAETLFDVVSYYDQTFFMFLSGQELADLTAFLSAL
jgi:cytochrome c peroxidase